ncbi:MAG: prepilin-type N-terminal cleavage/methylation domain-containing protein [Weeksellaceae bacterium]
MKKNQGFTIIELIIFITLLSTILVVAASYVTRLLYNMTTNEHRVKARFYAEEVVEWLNGERQSDWQAFQNEASVAGTVYCLNGTISLDTLLQDLTPGACSGTNNGYVGVGNRAPKIFKRELTLTKNTASNATQVTARITVSWVDRDIEYSVPIETIYSIYE